MSDSLIEQVKRLAEAQKKCWASKWPLERLSDTSLGADTRCMVQVGVTDDGEPIGEVDGGLEPVAEGHKDVLDLLVASLGFDFPALLAELQRKDAALKIYQARAHRNANSTCDGCPFAVAERDVNWADRAEGYYTCGLDNKERWGEDPACPDALYKEPPCQTA